MKVLCRAPVKHRVATVTSIRLALAAFAMGGCQAEQNALFDDSFFPMRDPSGAGTAGVGTGPEVPGVAGSGVGGVAAAGSDAGGMPSGAGAGGVGPGGMPALGGTTSDAGASTMGGASTAGGSTTGGAPTEGGSAAGGSFATAGAAGLGGTGTVEYGAPVTTESQRFDDTFVIACHPQASYRMEATLVVDSEPCQAEVLLKPPIAGIPRDALVMNATVTLSCTNPGPGLTLFRPQAPWAIESVSWATRPVPTQFLASLGAVAEGPWVIDVTTPVRAWVDGSLEPLGIGLRTSHKDGVIFASSRAVEANQRPRFSITYALPLAK